MVHSQYSMKSPGDYIGDNFPDTHLTRSPSDCPTTNREKVYSYASEMIRTDENEKFISFGFSRQIWFLFSGDLIFVALANFLSAWIRFASPTFLFSNIAQYALALLVTLFFYPLSLYVFDLYSMRRLFRSWETLYRTILAVLLGSVLCIVTFYLVPQGQYGRGIMAIQMVLTCLFLTGWRWAYGLCFQASKWRIPVLILGAGQAGMVIYDLLKSPLSPYVVRGFLDDNPAKLGLSRSPAVLGTCEQLEEIVNQVGAQTVILAITGNRSPILVKNILNARLKGLDIKEMADVYEQLTGRIPIGHIEDQWLLFAEGFYLLRREYVQNFKRLIDLTVSILLIVFTTPLFVLLALLIRISSRGPIFFKQKRVGKNQAVFTIYKFRTMSVNAEENGAQWASPDDPRVTKIGRFFRLTHIDELPQLWNVFRGDMSLIGPRPERPEFVKILEQQIPYYAIRHSVRPGITGWAQVRFSYGASVEDAFHKAECDLYYIKNMSLFLDFKILLRTIGVVFLVEGAR